MSEQVWSWVSVAEVCGCSIGLAWWLYYPTLRRQEKQQMQQMEWLGTLCFGVGVHRVSLGKENDLPLFVCLLFFTSFMWTLHQWNDNSCRRNRIFFSSLTTNNCNYASLFSHVRRRFEGLTRNCHGSYQNDCSMKETDDKLTPITITRYQIIMTVLWHRSPFMALPLVARASFGRCPRRCHLHRVALYVTHGSRSAFLSFVLFLLLR